MAEDNRTEQELQELKARLASAESREAELQAQVAALEKLNEALQHVSGHLELETITREFEDAIRGTVPFDFAAISLYRNERQWELLATGELFAAPETIGTAGSATSWVVANRCPLIRGNILKEDRFRLSDRTREIGIQSDIILPLIVHDRVIGTASVASLQQNSYSQSHVEFLQPVLDHIAVHVDNARLHRELEESYRHLRMIFNRAAELIFLAQVGDDGSFLYISVNDALVRETGLTREQILGKTPKEVVPKAADFHSAKYREAVEKRESVIFEAAVELPVGIIEFETVLTPVLDDTGKCTHLIGVSTNLTQARHSEQEIIRLERLHALEEMARGVAHNFNNILVGVLGNAELIELYSTDPQAVESAHEISQSALRASDLVRRLNLSVGKGVDKAPEQIESLNAIVEEAIEATRPRWKDEAEVRGVAIGMETGLGYVPAILADRTGLYQTLVHLISNAVDALPRDGTIHLTTSSVGESVQVAVRDTGVGMSEDIKRRIFDPFFTTKQDVGSGLGLSMAYRTIASWGGHIAVESEPEKGTTVTLSLPVWREPEPDLEPALDAARNAGLEGRLMLVDDEHAVRKVLKRILKEFDLVVFGDAPAALRDFEKGDFRVALIDLGIPGMTGDELARKLKAIDPELVTILITGWEIVAGDPRLESFDHHVQKPFSLAEIQNLVRRVAVR